MKKCTKCGTEKPLEDFGKDKSRKDGKKYVCKSCSNIYSANYAATHKAEKHTRDVLRYAVHKDEELARSAVYRATHREESSRRASAYARANPEMVAAQNANRRARIKLSKEDRAETIAWRKEHEGDVCYYCEQRTDNMHWDHITPLSRGGTDNYWNLARACSTCNLRKHTKTDMEYLATMPYRS